MILSKLIPEIDSHTHTVLSGHAWSTLNENVLAAKSKGMKGLCLTEHVGICPNSPPVFLPHSTQMLPDEIHGLRVYKGIEANLVGDDGAADVPNDFLRLSEFVVASIHNFDFVFDRRADNTEVYLGALKNPYIDILGHSDDPRVPFDFDAVLPRAATLGKLVEFNNNSLTPHRPNSKPSLVKFIEACKRYNVRVCVASDAHFDTMVGSVGPMMALLEELHFPEELIVNLYKDRFEAYLKERKNRVEAFEKTL